MSKDQTKSYPADSANKDAQYNGKLVGNKNLQGKGLQNPAVEPSQKVAPSKKDSGKDMKRT